MNHKILYLDDDAGQLASLQARLNPFCKLITMANPIDAIQFLKTNEVDAIISDMHMPIINGAKFFELLKENNLSHTPFFFLSNDRSTDTKVTGLKSGAFDYLTHDMSDDEIYLRIKNRLDEKKLSYKHIIIDMQRFLALADNRPLELTQIEFKILLLIVKSHGQLISREELKNFIWPNMTVLDKTINSHLTNLRAKVETSDFKIISIKGKGIAVVEVGIASEKLD